ncbi:MAG: hypothetical protein EA402_06750 [Planctomycetota bacterium]|nr:MAG: hypothetical protein EA402_06750 [Planctomycetota bacterium]
MSNATILFTCEACGVQGRVPDNFRGKTARCPSCKHVQVIPMDAPSPPPSGKTERIAQPTITRSFANTKSGEVSDETRGRAMLGIIERLEKIENLNERLTGSLQRLQTQSHAGEEDIGDRLAQLQSNLTQTQHAVTALHHMETRLEAMGRKIDVLQRSQSRQEQNKQFEDLSDQLKSLQKQVERRGDVAASGPDPRLDECLQRLAELESQLTASQASGGATEADPALLEALSASIKALREDHDERLESLAVNLAELGGQIDDLPQGEATAAGLDEGVVEDLRSEIAAVRDELAALPVGAPAAAASAKGASPLLAILALLFALAVGGFAGFIYLQLQESQSATAALESRLGQLSAESDRRIAALGERLQASEQNASELASTLTRRVEESRTLVATLSAAVDTTRASLTDLGSSIEAVTTRQQAQAASQATTLVAMDGRMTTVSEQVRELERWAETMGGMAGAEAEGESLRTSLQNIRGQITAMTTKLDATSNQVQRLSAAAGLAAEDD